MYSRYHVTWCPFFFKLIHQILNLLINDFDQLIILKFTTMEFSAPLNFDIRRFLVQRRNLHQRNIFTGFHRLLSWLLTDFLQQHKIVCFRERKKKCRKFGSFIVWTKAVASNFLQNKVGVNKERERERSIEVIKAISKLDSMLAAILWAQSCAIWADSFTWGSACLFQFISWSSTRCQTDVMLFDRGRCDCTGHPSAIFFFKFLVRLRVFFLF